ncbi:ash family protein [Escherichia coli]|uniref:ash family protein n=1 Tax=Escherichia coli TaxID=562 RepID=UPI0012FF857A|nr:ash family protein [Escherichia coli]EIH4169640.1 ash family protein [Escherichia coli]EIH4283987.1 ash family protein [Escherichia coli]EKC9998554.1 ash family protein [Escherichia coli]
MSRQTKKSLNVVSAWWYFSAAATVLAVGCGSLNLSTATSDAASVFFVVVTLYAMMRHIMVRCYPTGAVANLSYGRGRITSTTMSMVAQAGPTSVGPVPVDTGTSTPVWAIANSVEAFAIASFDCQRRLPQWLQSQPKSAQNSRSPNSAVTVVAGFIVCRWLRVIITFSVSLITPAQSIFVFRTYCLTSSMILRL